jgi:hypothetical protein
MFGRTFFEGKKSMGDEMFQGNETLWKYFFKMHMTLRVYSDNLRVKLYTILFTEGLLYIKFSLQL